MRKQAGQTLLEIMLAFSVSIMVLSAVIMGVVTSLSNTQYTKNQGLANSYAREGMAVVRQLRDSSWDTFVKKIDIYYCLGENLAVGLTSSTSPLASCGQNVGIFSRKVIIEHDPSSNCSNVFINGSKVTVKVSWPDSKCPAGVGNPYCHSVELISCLSNIDLKPTP